MLNGAMGSGCLNCSRFACLLVLLNPLDNRATKYLPSKRWCLLSKTEYVPSTSSLINLH